MKYAATDPTKLVNPTSIVPVLADIVAPPSYCSFILVKILFEKIAMASIPVKTLKNVIATTMYVDLRYCLSQRTWFKEGSSDLSFVFSSID